MTASTQTPLNTGARAYRWARKNLFRTWLDALLTVVFGGLALYILVKFLQFVFVTGRWGIIDVNLRLLLVGRWPSDQLSVIAVTVVVMGFWGGLIAGVVHRRQVRGGTSHVATLSLSDRISDLVRRFGLILGSVLLLLSLTDTGGPWLMAGATVVAGTAGRAVGDVLGRTTMPRWTARIAILATAAIPFALFFYLNRTVPLEDWEGFYFNFASALAGIILSFPLGVLLALARRSKLRLLQGLSVAYIEFVRGAPLFVLLLMANVSLEFFVPASLAPSKVIRAIVVFTIFTGAYLAEIVRGGLQSVPRGQEEAAKSLGLSPTKQMGLIVLPQALRNVIPAQIGQFISLFKDTTLAGLALGILDLLNAAQAITQQEGFRGQGLIVETLVFVGFLFWVGSFTMSRESQRLERKLGVGTR